MIEQVELALLRLAEGDQVERRPGELLVPGDLSALGRSPQMVPVW